MPPAARRPPDLRSAPPPGQGDPPPRGPPYPARVISPAVSEATATQQWICESCGFIYDPEEGDPDGGVPAGTGVEGNPRGWGCPGCGARKKGFAPPQGPAPPASPPSG